MGFLNDILYISSLFLNNKLTATDDKQDLRGWPQVIISRIYSKSKMYKLKKTCILKRAFYTFLSTHVLYASV